jgi:signal transduction histidine kinase
MAFKIVARTLLELGAELISSDAVALYELVKNAVDAGSPTVRIAVQCVLLHSRYQQALEEIDENRPLSTVRQNIETWISGDAPAPAKRAFLQKLDAAGNARSAFRDALVSSYADLNFIEIQDDGEGMSLDELNEVYLTVGTRSRKKAKLDWKVDTEPARVPLGDKGVGRLSVMRLGEALEVRTSKQGESHWNELRIDWTDFSHESDALLHEIPVAAKKGRRKDDADASGTTIRITELRADWTREKFGELLLVDFSRMVDPFDRRRANRLFRIFFNGEQVTIPQIARRLFEVAHATVEFSFFYGESGDAKLTGEIHYKLHAERKKPLSLGEVQLVALTGAKSTKVIRGLGPFKAEFIWFNRRYLTALDGLGTRTDVAELVRQWAGGLMMFRDGFRINPYGGPDDDWLHLDKKAFSRRGYKLNRQQIIGRVNISWRNKFLVEQTNREGLVDNDYKDALMKILQHVLEDFKTFTQNIEDSLKREELTSIDLLKQRVKDARTEVIKRIRQIAVNVPKQASALQHVERLVQQMSKQIEGVDEVIEDYKDERRKFVHLAGLGLMIELILHELTRVTGNTLGTLEGVDPKVLPGKLPAVFDTLETQLKTLQKRLKTLDPLSTARRQIKEPFDIADVVQEIVDARDAQIKRHKIDVRITADSDKTWRIKAVKGMLIQIVENLLSNSFYWLKHQAIVDPAFRPRVIIELNGKEHFLSVTDNGPGIEPARKDEIFQPFVTSKPPGQGSGLGLYIARELASYHGWSLELVAPPKPAGKPVHTFVLDFSGGDKS